MPSDRFQRVRTLYLTARDLDGDERRVYLERECDDASVLAEVEQFLSADTEDDTFLEPHPRAPRTDSNAVNPTDGNVHAPSGTPVIPDEDVARRIDGG